MRQVTIKKIISNDDVHYRVDRRIRKFKEGEILKFNTADGDKIAVVAVDKDVNCRDCIFCNSGKCPVFRAEPLHIPDVLCDHHRYEDMYIYFKPIDSVLEDL